MAALFNGKSKNYQYANKCISVITKDLKNETTKGQLAQSKKEKFHQMYRSVKEFVTKAKFKKTETKKIQEKVDGLSYRLNLHGVFEAKSLSEHSYSNSKGKSASKFIYVGPTTSKKEAPTSGEEEEEEDTYKPPTLPDYDNFLPREKSKPTPKKRQKINPTTVYETETSRKNSNSSKNEEQKDNPFIAPKFKSFANKDKSRPTIKQQRPITCDEASNLEMYNEFNRSNYFAFPKKKKDVNVDNESLSTYEQSHSQEENILTDSDDETFDFENLEILNTNMQTEDTFDYKILQTLTPNKSFTRLDKYIQSLDEKVHNFQGVANSLEYVWLEEQLTKIVEALNKIKCENDVKALKRRETHLSTVRMLFEFLECYEDEDDGDEDTDEDETEDEDDDE